MTIEELMIPRYRVALKYPNSKFEVGDIIMQMPVVNISNDTRVVIYRRISGKFAGQSVGEPGISHPEEYPGVFVKMVWWEGRTAQEIPIYVRYGEFTGRHRVYKIKELHWLSDSDYSGRDTYAIAEEPDDYYLPFTGGSFYPATEQEYLHNETLRKKTASA